MQLVRRAASKNWVSVHLIAQGHLLADSMQQRCIYLVDDLGAELDPAYHKALCRLLEQRVPGFITGTEPGSELRLAQGNARQHVPRGTWPQ